MSWTFRRMICGMCLLVPLSTASAQPHSTLPEPKHGTFENLVCVPAPHARWVAISEAHRLLAFAHDLPNQDFHVSLVKLDDKGQPAAYRVGWKLPKPAGLKADNFALSVAFHPKLPLLYVWQEINQTYTNPPGPVPPELNRFDHLLLYNIAKDPPELLLSLCRGPALLYGMMGGAIAVDPAGEHLYVPNLREAKNIGWLHFGRFRLDADGLPLIDENDAKLPVAARIKKLSESNVAKGVVPTQLTPVEYVYNFPFSNFGTGNSYHVLSKDVILAGGARGVMTWRPEDREARLHGLPLTGGDHTLLTAHPTLPLVFATVYNTDSFFRVEHSDGYWSLLPHQITIPQTRLFSAPVVLNKYKKVAVGGHHHVYFVSLDDNGQVKSEVMKVQVLCPMVRAMTYSEKFDRLYVGVESSQ